MTTETPEQQRMIDEAVNTKGFLEFMNAHSDSKPEDINDPKLVAERFETFKRKEEVKTEVVNIFGEQIEKDFDIRLDTKDKESIGAYIDKQAIEDPKKLEKLRDLIGLFRTLPNQIASLTGQIKNLGTTPEQIAKQRELESDLEKMESVKEGNEWFGVNRFIHRFMPVMLNHTPIFGYYAEWFGVNRFIHRFMPKRFGGNEEIVKNTQDLAGRYGAEIKSSEGFDKVTNKIKAQIAEIEKNLELTANLEDAQKKFDSARRELLRESKEIGDLVARIQLRVKMAMDTMLSRASTTKHLSETQERFERFQKSKDESETEINPLATIDEDKYQTDVNQKVETKVFEEISRVIDNLDLSKGNPYERLQSVLNPYLNMNRLGSADQETTRRFIIETVEDVLGKLPNDNTGKIKSMMLARILFKAKQK